MILLLSIFALALLLDNRQLRRALEDETTWRREMEPHAMRGRWAGRKEMKR